MKQKNIAVYVDHSGRIHMLDITGISDPSCVDAKLGRKNWYGMTTDSSEMALLEFCLREQAALSPTKPKPREPGLT